MGEARTQNIVWYILGRVLQAVPTVILVTVVVFLLTRLSGDPASLILGDWAGEEEIVALRNEWGLDDPIVVQYARYLRGLFLGDLGQSLRYNRPVSALIAGRFGASALLSISSVIIAVVVALPIGVIAASRWRSMTDFMVRLTVVIGQAIPRFYLALLLMLFFGLYLKVLPTGGYGTFRNLILPAATLATPTAVLLTRLTRSSVLEVLHKDYTQTARSKGLTERIVLFKHVFRNALITPITMIGMQLALVFGHAVVVETVFSWPGLGRLAVTSVYTRDFPLLQGIVLVFCLLIIVADIVVDISYSLIDPRIRSS